MTKPRSKTKGKAITLPSPCADCRFETTKDAHGRQVPVWKPCALHASGHAALFAPLP